MIRALFVALSIFVFAAPVSAQTSQPLTLTLIRAVRVSGTSITLSFKTSESATGEVAYTEADGSKFTLTDSIPQKNHLFTINQLDPKHGYSFALTATTESNASNIYTVLLSPESLGAPGTSLMPSVQVTTASGTVVATIKAASSTLYDNKPIAPWWVFALLFILVIMGWIAWRSSPRFQRLHG